MIGLILIVSIILIFLASQICLNLFLKFDLIGFLNQKVVQKVFVFKNKWWFWPILFVFIYLIILGFYALFAYPLGAPNAILYPNGDKNVNLSNQAKIAREFVANSNYSYIGILGIILTLLVIIFIIFLIKNKKFKIEHLLMGFILLGIIGRLIYGLSTDNIFTRQHDTWSSVSSYGHYGITIYIYNNFIPPDMREGMVNGVLTPSLDFSYQLYHPKFAHYANAIAMHFNSLFFHEDVSWSLFQSVRILTITISIFTLIATYYIFKELSDKKTFQIIGTAFVAFSPLMFRLSAMSNNDPYLYFFLTLSILFLIRFYKNQNISNIIFIAISIGLAMASKLSGALIALPTAFVFLFILIKMIKNKQLPKAIFLFSIFIIICFPLGLFWPIYNMIRYDQPLNYVYSNLNQNLAIPDTYSYFDKFLSFPINQYFSNMWMQLWNDVTTYPMDYNLYTSMIKSSIFGEFSYMNYASLVFAAILYVINFVLVIGLILMGIYVVINSIIKKNYALLLTTSTPLLLYIIFVLVRSNQIYMYIVSFILILLIVYLVILNRKNFKNVCKHKASLLMSFIFLTFMISYLVFQIEYPYGCTQDFRYIGLFILIGGYFIARFIATNKVKWINIVLITIITIYLTSSYFMYIFVSL